MCRNCVHHRGILRVNQDIEIRPGIVTKDAEGRVSCRPILTSIVSLFVLAFATPGGLIGVGTKIDPTLSRSDAWGRGQASKCLF